MPAAAIWAYACLSSLASRDPSIHLRLPLYCSHQPDEDDVVVEKLRDAGAIIMGKKDQHFGIRLWGHWPQRLVATTRNPWNLALTPGRFGFNSLAARKAGIAIASSVIEAFSPRCIGRTCGFDDAVHKSAYLMNPDNAS